MGRSGTPGRQSAGETRPLRTHRRADLSNGPRASPAHSINSTVSVGSFPTSRSCLCGFIESKDAGLPRPNIIPDLEVNPTLKGPVLLPTPAREDCQAGVVSCPAVSPLRTGPVDWSCDGRRPAGGPLAHGPACGRVPQLSSLGTHGSSASRGTHGLSSASLPPACHSWTVTS